MPARKKTAKKAAKKTPKKKEKKLILQPPKGMHDILPTEQPLWERVYRTVKETAEFYQFKKIHTPIVERAAIFETSVGETTEVVEKQMYTFRAGSDKLALRPENTAAIVRAYIQHGLGNMLGSPTKLYYYGPFFRHEQPQKGRSREFHQAGFEIIGGEYDPIYDAQIILTSMRLLEALKLKNCTVKVNSIGLPKARVQYVRKLKTFFKEHRKVLTAQQKQRLEKNPLRLLDSKDENIQELKKNAPIMLDHLAGDSRKHFMKVLELLDELSIPYELDHTLVRGLDYYTHTVFEIFTEGFDSALVAGGRYDNLVSMLGGGEPKPAVGSAAGIDRIIEVIKEQGIRLTQKSRPPVFLIHIGATAKQKSLKIIEEFRKEGLSITEALGKESMKAQMRQADKIGSPMALILGQKEVYEDSIIIRDMKTGAQETVPLGKVAETIKKKIKNK